MLSKTLFSPRRLRMALVLLLAGFFVGVAAPAALAQDPDSLNDLSIRPIFVTTRIFQMKAKRGSYGELNEQVFRQRTTSLTDDEKWQNNFRKLYPGVEVSLLRTDVRRVFRTAKPAVLSLVRQADGREIQIQMYGAQSPGDGTTPGTTLIPEVGLHFGNDNIKKPISFSIQPLEVESGMTYFFAATGLRLTSTDYVKFVRPNIPVENYDGHDIYLLFAFSVDLDKTTAPARLLDERQSRELQAQATKAVQPEIPESLRKAGYGGSVRVQVEIAPTGKVTGANVYISNFPEINANAVAAARQWEFPASLFAENKTPITAFLTFTIPAQAVAQPPSQSATKQ